MTSPPLPPRARSVLRILRRIALLLLAAWAMRWLGLRIEAEVHALSPEKAGLAVAAMVAVILLGYAILIAVPFVPGIEIGLTLIMMRGPSVVPWVYLATILGLAMAYCAGRFLPYLWLRRFFLDLRLERAAALIDRIEPMTPDQRLDHLRSFLPQRAGPLMLRWRYVALGLLVNIPGNGLLGGGGGILMAAGISRLFGPLATLITMLIAVSPIPLAVWVFGIDPLEQLKLW